MDVHMDDIEPDSTVDDRLQEPEKSPSPLLRPGSMVAMTLTLEDYETQYWPKLKNAIEQLLIIKPGCYIPLSYEQMYSCVYKCVCKQFSERLYTDLLTHMSQHVQKLNSDLYTNMEDSSQFISAFSLTMHQYLQALGGIVPIFNYMNRFYVENKLKKDLHEELKRLFTLQCVDNHIQHLLNLLEEISVQPFAISPPTMASLITSLYSLNPDYAELKPALFARYIPNILPPTSVMEMDKYIEEAKEMQRKICQQPGFDRCDRSRKRSCEEDIPVV